MPPALLSLDITPKTPADQEKLARALQVLAAEDPDLRVSAGVARACTVIGATSEAHLEQVVDRLTREFEVEASVSMPTVAYLETLTRSAEGSAKHVRIAHGQGEYAHVSLRLRPAGTGTGYSFEDTTIGGAIPKRFMTAIDTGIRDSMANGVLRGYPIVGVRRRKGEQQSSMPPCRRFLAGSAPLQSCLLTNSLSNPHDRSPMFSSFV